MPVGIVVGSSRPLYRAVRAVIEFLRPIPSVALIPLAVLIYGSGLESKVFLAAFASTWPLLMQTLYGVQDVDPVATDTARSFGFSRPQRLLYVTLPSAVPYIATGVRISAAVALILVVTAELVIGAPGLGREINLARQGEAVELMYALIVVTGLLGWRVNVLFTRIERRVLHWHPSQRRRWPGEDAGAVLALEIAVPLALLVLWGVWSSGSDTYYFPPLTTSSNVRRHVGVRARRLRRRPEPRAARPRLRDRLRGRRRRRAGARLSRPLRRAIDPVVQFLRSIPPPALLPFGILVLGVGTSMKVFIIAFVCLWPVLLNTIDGVAGRRPDAARDRARLRHQPARPGAARDPAAPRRRSSPACARASRWR